MMTSSNGNIFCVLAFVRGIHRSAVNSPHKGQWRGALMFSLTCPLNEQLSKQYWWFETPSHPHHNVTIMFTGIMNFSILCRSDVTNAWLMYWASIKPPIFLQEAFQKTFSWNTFFMLLFKFHSSVFPGVELDKLAQVMDWHRSGNNSSTEPRLTHVNDAIWRHSHYRKWYWLWDMIIYPCARYLLYGHPFTNSD